MRKLGHRELKDVLYVTCIALNCGTVDELRKEVLYCLERMFECEKSGFFLVQMPHRWVDCLGSVVRGIDRDFLTIYDQRYRALDPYIEIEWPNLPPVATPEEIFPSSDLIASEYYNDFLKPQSIRHILTMFLKSDRQPLGAVGLFRPSYASSFTARDKAKAELIVPYLVGILEEKMLSNHIMHCAKVFESVALGWPHKGIMLLNDSLEPIYVSDEAHVLMNSLCRKEHAHDRLQCSLPEEIYRCCEELRRCEEDQDYTEPLQRQFTLAEGKKDQKLSVLLRLLMHENRTLFLVGFVPGDPAVSMHRRLNKLGLSQREAEVAWLVFNGMELSEVCDKLCISHHTVKSHLKSIYEKLGVHTRANLIRRLTNLN